ncbi:MAG: phosphatidylserine decarboxylase [Proteobacteria bacterium]|nr:phosphatidylserine decarboxylase [Pseudomonadota bacterium]
MRAAVLKTVLVPIASDGWPFIGGLAILSLFTLWLFEPLGWAVVLSTLWCTYFFRDPDRVVPIRPGLIVSPADGVVQAITRATPPAELGMGMHARPRISIFLNIFDVHVNRVPLAGTVTRIAYNKGKFVNAGLDKASLDNERNGVRLLLEDGRDLAFVQIAGLIARRIVCRLKEGEMVRTGERFGMIRFGSRADVYLPDGIAPLVAVGQRAIAGETVLADLNLTEPPRLGEIR